MRIVYCALPLRILVTWLISPANVVLRTLLLRVIVYSICPLHQWPIQGNPTPRLIAPVHYATALTCFLFHPLPDFAITPFVLLLVIITAADATVTTLSSSPHRTLTLINVRHSMFALGYHNILELTISATSLPVLRSIALWNCVKFSLTLIAAGALPRLFRFHLCTGLISADVAQVHVWQWHITKTV